jgi:predicted metal-dependent hydrolase
MFAQKRQAWISAQLSKHPPSIFKDSDLIGKAHRLHFIEASTPTVVLKSKVNPTSIMITTSLKTSSAAVQDKTRQAAEKALKNEADNLLLPRLEQLAVKYGYSYNGAKVRKLTARWGSCSSAKQISLSFYLVQLPWNLIDYVLLHELAHTTYLNHSKDFWEEVSRILPDYKRHRRAIKQYKPTILPSPVNVVP